MYSLVKPVNFKIIFLRGQQFCFCQLIFSYVHRGVRHKSYSKFKNKSVLILVISDLNKIMLIALMKALRNVVWHNERFKRIRNKKIKKYSTTLIALIVRLPVTNIVFLVTKAPVSLLKVIFCIFKMAATQLISVTILF